MLHRKKIRAPTLGLLFLALIALPLTASTVFSDRGLWESATTGLTNIDFTGLAGNQLPPAERVV